MAAMLYENGKPASVFIKLDDFFSPVIPSCGYSLGITQKEYNICSGAQLLCCVTPSDGSFTEMWDSPSSYLGVPYFGKAPILGLYPTQNHYYTLLILLILQQHSLLHPANNTEDFILQIVFR
jgi:hypothetical protein